MKIQVSITGYAGDPISLIAAINPVTGVLAVNKMIKFREAADEGFAFVTNTRSRSYDSLFTEDNWEEAIRAFYVGEANQTLAIGEAAARFRPRIELDGVGEKGQKYRLHEDLSNGEVAILALVYFQQRQDAITAGTSAMDGWTELLML